MNARYAGRAGGGVDVGGGGCLGGGGGAGVYGAVAIGAAGRAWLLIHIWVRRVFSSTESSSEIRSPPASKKKK